MFDLKYLPSSRQPMTKQLDKQHREGIHGGPNFLTRFRNTCKSSIESSGLSMTCIMFNHLTYLIGSSCMLAYNVHADLRQLSYGSITVKSYGRYNVNGFHFHSTIFESSRSMAATTNIRVITRVVDAEEQSTTGSLKT
jgi:hypothetical protein